MDKLSEDTQPRPVSFQGESQKELHEGKMTWAELSKWFGLKPDSITKDAKRRQKKLKILELYADFHIETVGKSGKKTCIIIDKVRIPVYSKAREIVRQEVEKYRQSIDTASRIGREIHKKNNIVHNSLKPSTTIAYTGDDLVIDFGRLYVKGDQGRKGYRHPIWAQYIYDEVNDVNYYRRLSEEENAKIVEARKEADIDMNKDEDLFKSIIGQIQNKKYLTLEEKGLIYDQTASQVSGMRYETFIELAEKKLGFRPIIVSEFVESAWTDESEQQN